MSMLYTICMSILDTLCMSMLGTLYMSMLDTLLMSMLDTIYVYARHTIDGYARCLYTAMCWQEMWDGSKPRLAVPLDLLKAIQQVNPSFRGYLQQVSEYFINY